MIPTINTLLRGSNMLRINSSMSCLLRMVRTVRILTAHRAALIIISRMSPQGGYVPPQGYYANQGYGYNAPYQQPQQSTGMAVASLVLGILSICTGLFMFNVPFLFLLPIIGIILGIVFKCKKLPVGKGMSTAGIITSAIGLAIPLALLAFVIVMLLTHGAELMQYLKEISPDQYEQLYEIYGDQFPQWFDAAVSFLIK